MMGANENDEIGNDDDDMCDSLIAVSFQYKVICWLVGFLTSSSTTRLYRGRAPRQSVWQFYVLPHMRQSWETMTSISAGHIILTPTQPVGSGRPQRGSNPRPPDQESRALPTELPRPPYKVISCLFYNIKHKLGQAMVVAVDDDSACCYGNNQGRNGCHLLWIYPV